MKLLQDLSVITESSQFYPTSKKKPRVTAPKESNFMDLYAQVEDHIHSIHTIIRTGGPLRKESRKVLKELSTLDSALQHLNSLKKSMEEFQDAVYSAENEGK